MIVESSGTQTAVVGTEHTLATPSAVKTRSLLVDLANMVAGDTVELRIKAAVLVSGTVSLVSIATFSGVIADPHAQSPPVLCPQGATFTLKQTTGTARTYPWAIVTLD